MTLNYEARNSVRTRVVSFIKIRFGIGGAIYRRCHKSDFKLFTAEFIQ